MNESDITGHSEVVVESISPIRDKLFANALHDILDIPKEYKIGFFEFPILVADPLDILVDESVYKIMKQE